MGFLDDAKKKINDNADKIDSAVGKAADMAKKKTGGKYDDKIDKAEKTIKDKTGNL